MAGKVPLENGGKNGRVTRYAFKIINWVLLESNKMQQNYIYKHTLYHTARAL
jgi:hypothetical protein